MKYKIGQKIVVGNPTPRTFYIGEIVGFEADKQLIVYQTDSGKIETITKQWADAINKEPKWI